MASRNDELHFLIDQNLISENLRPNRVLENMFGSGVIAPVLVIYTPQGVALSMKRNYFS